MLMDPDKLRGPDPLGNNDFNLLNGGRPVAGLRLLWTPALAWKVDDSTLEA
jgi:hypothetical protein